MSDLTGDDIDVVIEILNYTESKEKPITKILNTLFEQEKIDEMIYHLYEEDFIEGHVIEEIGGYTYSINKLNQKGQNFLNWCNDELVLNRAKEYVNKNNDVTLADLYQVIKFNSY